MDANIEKTIIGLLTDRKSLSDEQKATIKSMCKEAGIKMRFSKNCPNCYEDALVVLACHYQVTYKSRPLTASGNYYFMPKGEHVVWVKRGIKKVLGAYSTDEQIQDFVRNNPLQKYFVPVTADVAMGKVEQPKKETEEDDDD